MSKGSSRRPTDPRHALTCDTGHVWLGGRCFRCGVIGGVVTTLAEVMLWPQPSTGDADCE